MLLSGVMLSLGGCGFGDKHTRSGIFGLGGGETDFDRGGMSSLLGGGLGRDEGTSEQFGGEGAGVCVFCVAGILGLGGGGTNIDGGRMSLFTRDEEVTKRSRSR